MKYICVRMTLQGNMNNINSIQLKPLQHYQIILV